MCKTKMDVAAKQLCSSEWPSAFRKFLEVCQALKYEETPRYDACIELFRPLVSASAPIDIQRSPVYTMPAKVCQPCPIDSCSIVEAYPCTAAADLE